MIAACSVVSCNFSSPPLKARSSHLLRPSPSSSISSIVDSNGFPIFTRVVIKRRKSQLLLCKSSLDSKAPKDPLLAPFSEEEEEDGVLEAGGGGDNGQGPGERDWTTSFLLFIFWAGIMYYVTVLAPNQQPVTDAYLVKKLLNLKGDDGFQVNQVVVALWYIMGLWPLVYSMLLFPTARSTESKIPMWPFVVLSFAGGAYALIPYFVLWRPPAPPVQGSELRKWPLNFLESKVTTAVTLGAGIAALIYGLSSGGEVWMEYIQYFRGSKFIHVMSIDFVLLSTFAPFWVYNDMTSRKWRDDYRDSLWILPCCHCFHFLVQPFIFSFGLLYQNLKDHLISSWMNE